MKLSDTDKLQREYVSIYNYYMGLPDDSKEFNSLAKKLQELESVLAMRFLFESGYRMKEQGNLHIFIKDGQ